MYLETPDDDGKNLVGDGKRFVGDLEFQPIPCSTPWKEFYIGE
jgi:hypothetical protein